MAKANITTNAILTAILAESTESRRGVMPSMIGVLVNASSKEERCQVASQLRTLKEMGLIHSVEEGRVLCTQQGELAARDMVEAPADPAPTNDVAKQETAPDAAPVATTAQQDPEMSETLTLNSLQQGVINTLGFTGALNYGTRVAREHVLKRMRHRGHVSADGRALGPCMARMARLGLIQKHMDHTWSLTEKGLAYYSATPDEEPSRAPERASAEEGSYLPPVATADDIAMAMRYPDEPERLTDGMTLPVVCTCGKALTQEEQHYYGRRCEACESAYRYDEPVPEADRPTLSRLLDTLLDSRLSNRHDVCLQNDLTQLLAGLGSRAHAEAQHNPSTKEDLLALADECNRLLRQLAGALIVPGARPQAVKEDDDSDRVAA